MIRLRLKHILVGSGKVVSNDSGNSQHCYHAMKCFVEDCGVESLKRDLGSRNTWV